MAPHVSFLIPVRDASETIVESLGTVRAQTFEDFEVVLVDDGSTDDGIERARRIFHGDNRLRVLTPGRVGLVAALQCGLDACRGRFVARFDADDRCAPERLEAQLPLLEEASIVGSRVESFSGEKLGEGFRLYDEWTNDLVEHDDIVREMFIESPLAHPSVTFRRSEVLRLGGYCDMGWPEDYDLWLRARAAGLRFAKAPEVLLHWRDHPGRASRVDPRYEQDAFWKCKAHHLARGPLKDRAKVVVWGAGRQSRRFARFLAREGVHTLAFVDIDPKKIGGSPGGIPVVDATGLEALRGEMLLGAVGSRGARAEIRAEVTARGWVEGVDFFCVA